ncbi:hypothetical protein NBRC10513v2_002920 [Rhodotorula toruloides]
MASPHPAAATRPASVASPQPGQSAHQPVQPVRLPPVTLPPADFLDPAGFNPARRQSINSDPVLHAFSAPADASSQPQPQPHDSYAHPSHQRHPLADGGHPLHGGEGEMDGPGGGGGGQRYGQPGSEGGQGQIHFSTSFLPPSSLAPAGHYPHPSLGPPANYRFGGPPPPPHPAQQPHDSTSYFDYSMRRHSLTNNAQAMQQPSQPHPGAQDLPPPVPLPNLKRKTSGDDAEADDSYSYRPSSSYPDNQGHLVNAPPHPKRRTSSLTFDKMNNLSLAEQARRDSSYGPMSPWEDDRRGSGESYASLGSQGYSVPAYHHPQQAYDQRGPPQAPYSTAGGPMPPAQAWDAHQVGPRGSISRGGPYEQQQPNEPFTRRPSIPSVSQMMQGQQAFYPAQSGPPPQSAPPTQPHPPQPFASVSRAGPGHPSVVVSSLPHTPTEMDDPSRLGPYATPTSAGPYPGSQQQAPWVRTNAPPSHPQPTRQGSSSSLDPSSAYGPGQVPPSKETPYSRSPELRVSHKLAERKRRKEMAQLFEDLRESLPFDRALKASKWEILSKAIEYVGTLKSYCHELASENRSMREHYNLPPSSIEEPPGLGSAADHFRPDLDGSATSTIRGAQSPSPEASPAPNSLHNGSPFPPSSNLSSSHNPTPAPPARPRSQASQGQVQWHQHRQYQPTGSPMQGPPPKLKLAEVVAPNGGLPQPSPPLSQHSSNASGSPVVGANAPIDPLDHATSPVVTNGVAA